VARLSGSAGLRRSLRAARDRREPGGGIAAAVGRPAPPRMRRLRDVNAGNVALVALVILALAVILVPALASRDPSRIDDVLARRLVPPFGRDAHGTLHLLGTDRFGRDLFVRM